jgi:hypothetical protein
MKKLLLTIVVLFIYSSAFAQKISFSETTYHFGDVPQNATVTHNFEIKNTGDEVLKINKVRASCGCTAAKPDKSALEPGETTMLKVDFHTSQRRGEQRKYVYVFSNDPENPQYRLKFTANVLVNSGKDKAQNKNLEFPEIKLEKNQYNFGDVKEGEVVTAEIPYKNVGESVLKINNVKSSCGCTAVVLEGKELKPNEAGTLKIELDTSNYSGRITRTVTLFSNDPKNNRETILLFANVKKG